MIPVFWYFPRFWFAWIAALRAFPLRKPNCRTLHGAFRRVKPQSARGVLMMSFFAQGLRLEREDVRLCATDKLLLLHDGCHSS